MVEQFFMQWNDPSKGSMYEPKVCMSYGSRDGTTAPLAKVDPVRGRTCAHALFTFLVSLEKKGDGVARLSLCVGQGIDPYLPSTIEC